MKLIRANMHRLDKSDQVLVRVLATMGIRRGEALTIERLANFIQCHRHGRDFIGTENYLMGFVF
jgi:hypothetical protein